MDFIIEMLEKGLFKQEYIERQTSYQEKRTTEENMKKTFDRYMSNTASNKELNDFIKFIYNEAEVRILYYQIKREYDENGKKFNNGYSSKLYDEMFGRNKYIMTYMVNLLENQGLKFKKNQEYDLKVVNQIRGQVLGEKERKKEEKTTFPQNEEKLKCILESIENGLTQKQIVSQNPDLFNCLKNLTDFIQTEIRTNEYLLGLYEEAKEEGRYRRQYKPREPLSDADTAKIDIIIESIRKGLKLWQVVDEHPELFKDKEDISNFIMVKIRNRPEMLEIYKKAREESKNRPMNHNEQDKVSIIIECVKQGLSYSQISEKYPGIFKSNNSVNTFISSKIKGNPDFWEEYLSAKEEGQERRKSKNNTWREENRAKIEIIIQCRNMGLRIKDIAKEYPQLFSSEQEISAFLNSLALKWTQKYQEYKRIRGFEGNVRMQSIREGIKKGLMAEEILQDNIDMFSNSDEIRSLMNMFFKKQPELKQLYEQVREISIKQKVEKARRKREDEFGEI